MQDCTKSLAFTYGLWTSFADFSLQNCIKILPFTFTHVLHNFLINYIWYQLNYYENPTAKYDHLPCHSQFRMHAYLRPSIEISTVWEIKDLFSIAGIPDGFLAHNTLTIYHTWLYVTFLRTDNCQFWMQGAPSKSLHVMWKCQD